MNESRDPGWFAAAVPGRKPAAATRWSTTLVLQDLQARPPAARMQRLPRICMKYQQQMLRAA